MNAGEIIRIVAPKDIYDRIAFEAFRYGIISVGFTFNRLDTPDIIPRIENIIKGKIAEGLIAYYSETHSLGLDFGSCSTPFWMPDQRDFLWLDGEWDIKNNFFFCSDEEAKTFDLTTLPALIPNKRDPDQWSKRDDLLHHQSKFSAYLFSFMRLLPNRRHFFSIALSPEQVAFILDTSNKHSLHHGAMPFESAWYYKQLEDLGVLRISMQYYPDLFITACANTRHWSLFYDTSIFDLHHYRDFMAQGWYNLDTNILKFLEGKLVTKIKNKTCPVRLLPSFLSVVQRHQSHIRK